MVPPTLQTTLFGLQLNTPVVLLSGCVGFGEEYNRIKGFDYQQIGAICLKGTTLLPQSGNWPQRIDETPSGMINAIGLQNPGANYVKQHILPALKKHPTHFIINISGNTKEEFGELCAIFDDSPISAIEINISCPNIKEGGLSFGNYPKMSAQVVQACRKRTNKPLLVKLSPNQTDIAQNALACIEQGCDGLCVTNTFTGMTIDIKQRKPVIYNNQGGISGPAIKPQALLKVHQVYQNTKHLNIPIIGQGGITTAEDALEFMIAGASAIGLGTAMFYEPLIYEKINQNIQKYLITHQMSLEEITGSLQLN